MSSDTCFLTKSVMTFKTWSCLVLKRRSSKAFLQWFRMWFKVCFLPQSLQASERPLHRARLALCGSVLLAMFKANFISNRGRAWIAFDHMMDAWVSTTRKSLPWVPRDILCSRRFLLSSLSTILFALLDAKRLNILIWWTRLRETVTQWIWSQWRSVLVVS